MKYQLKDYVQLLIVDQNQKLDILHNQLQNLGNVAKIAGDKYDENSKQLLIKICRLLGQLYDTTQSTNESSVSATRGLTNLNESGNSYI